MGNIDSNSSEIQIVGSKINFNDVPRLLQFQKATSVELRRNKFFL